MFIDNLSGTFIKHSGGMCIAVRPETDDTAKIMRIEVSEEFGDIDTAPERAKVAWLVPKNQRDGGILILLPETERDKTDERHFVIVSFRPWVPMANVGLHQERFSTGKVVDESYGYGKGGSGVVFCGLLKEGQRIVSTWHDGACAVVWVDGGKVKQDVLTYWQYARLVGLNNYEFKEL